VRLHIDRLVLDGIPLDGARVRDAVESELARLIGERGIAAQSLAVPSVRAPQITFAPDAKPAQLGSSIAGAVYDGSFPGVGGRKQ